MGSSQDPGHFEVRSLRFDLRVTEIVILKLKGKATAFPFFCPHY